MKLGLIGEDGLMSDLEQLRDELRIFSTDRDWAQFHTPRNLILALAGEVGELASLIQWVKEEDVDGWLEVNDNREAFADELADCLAYLIQVADETQIDLGHALSRKIAKNGQKYPVELARGTATKYTGLNGTGTL